MKAGLNAMGYPVSRKQCKVTTDSNHAKPLFDNRLNRDFAPAGPNQAYVQDITYIWTQQGWLYLAAVMDLYSRRVVGAGVPE